MAYPKGISSPTTARFGASRLSPHLAWGCISAGSVFRAIRQRERELAWDREDGRPVDPRWSRALRSFRERIRWLSHFIQKCKRCRGGVIGRPAARAPIRRPIQHE